MQSIEGESDEYESCPAICLRANPPRRTDPEAVADGSDGENPSGQSGAMVAGEATRATLPPHDDMLPVLVEARRRDARDRIWLLPFP